MLEPKYDEDTVNLGYLKKVISDTEEGIDNTYKNVSRHYASRPQPPYYKGDTWIDGDIVYTCINTRTIGLYQDSDWVTESGAKTEAERKNKTYLTQPSNYRPGDMWVLQSDEDHRAGKKGEILISTAGRKEYDSDDWVNMLGYGPIKSINEVAGNLNNAINRIGNVEEAIQDGLIITFYQDTVPEGKHLGDLWYVTGEVAGYIKGKIYRYDGTNWIILNDPSIQEAFDEANEARLVADGKIQSFYSEAEPTQNMGVGDLWIDLSNNNQLYRYNGTNWVAVYDTRINELVTTVETVTERVTTVETDLGEIDLKVKETTTKITTIEGNIDNIETLANNAQSTANSAVDGVNNITNTQGEAEGKNIHIEDSAEEPLVDISLHGETSQKARSGKNKLNLSRCSFFGCTLNSDNKSLTCSINNDYYAYVKTTELNNWLLQNKGKKITFSTGTPLEGKYTSIVIYGTRSSGSAYQEANEQGTGKCSITIADDFTAITAIELRFNRQFTKFTDTTTVINYTMLELGTTATDYEEYGVMPSPDYPSEIENIEGKNKFSGFVKGKGLNSKNGVETTNTTAATSDYIAVDFNQNPNYYLSGLTNTLFSFVGAYNNNKEFLGRTTAGAIYFLNLDKSKFASGTAQGTGDIAFIRVTQYENSSVTGTIDDIDNLETQLEKGYKATPYVPYNSLEFKVEGKNLQNTNLRNGIYNANTGEYSANSNYLSNTDMISVKPSILYSFSSDLGYSFEAYLYNKNKEYIGRAFAVNNAFTTSEETYYINWRTLTSGQNSLDCKVQLEIGEQTDYEPYKSQVAYFPLGEGDKLYQGSFLNDNGKNHVRKQVIFDGSDDEGWAAYLTGRANGYVYYTKAITDCVKALGTSICSHFKNLNYAWDVGSIGDYSDHPTLTYKYFVSDKATLAEWKAWLTANPITIEFDLAEPETVPYTEEQQEAWNKIKALMTYKNVTNITSDAYAKVTYMRDNGLDVYETKQNAQKKYTETSEKLAEQKMTVDGVITQVSETNKRLTNDYLTAEQVNAELDTTKEDIEIIKQNQVIMTQTSKNLQIAIDTINNEGVTKVKTSMGYTFDDEGFKLNRSNAETGTIIDEAAVQVIDKTGASEQNLLYAGYVKEGNTNYPSYIGQTIVASANMIVQNYLVVPNSRFEEYTNPVLGGKGTGVFEI